MAGIYCGSAKVRQTRFGDQYELRIFRDEIESLLEYMSENGLRSVRIDVGARREPKNEWTHYLKVNEWTPPGGDSGHAATERAGHIAEDVAPTPAQPTLPAADDDDIPF